MILKDISSKLQRVDLVRLHDSQATFVRDTTNVGVRNPAGTGPSSYLYVDDLHFPLNLEAAKSARGLKVTDLRNKTWILKFFELKEIST